MRRLSAQETVTRIVISLAIIDDNEYLRVGVRVSLKTDSNIAVTGEYSLQDEVASEVQGLKIDVASFGMRWPAADGLEVCRKIRRRAPATSVVMFSANSNEEEMLAAYLAGVGYRVNSHRDTFRCLQCGGACTD